MPKKISRSNRISEPNIRHDRPKKRKNIGQNVKSVEVNSLSASKRKIKFNSAVNVPEDSEMFYQIIDFYPVFSTLSSLVVCSECAGKVSFKSCRAEGLAFNLQVTCDKCKQPRNISSSEKIGSRYDINCRFAFVMRILGIGLSGCNKFCGLMDLSSHFLSKSAYTLYLKNIASTVKEVAENCFSSAVEEEIQINSEKNKIGDPKDLTVSGDGTWQKPGFNSLYGVSSLIAHYTGKVVDIFVSSKVCQACKLWMNKLNTVEYEEWQETHINNNECDANHDGPSGNMEVGAIKEMFKRSEKKHNVRYRNYVGDGDSKTFSALLKEKPYGSDFEVVKKECVGHVQKRMGKRLRDLVKNTVEEKDCPTIVEIGAYVAASTFNEGNKAYLICMNALEISCGHSAHEWAEIEDEERIDRAEKEASKESKDARIKRRRQEKQSQDHEADTEELLYGAGIDDSI